MTRSPWQERLEGALALVHGALAEPSLARIREAQQRAGEILAAIAHAPRSSWTLAEGHDIMGLIERLRSTAWLLEREFVVERSL